MRHGSDYRVGGIEYGSTLGGDVFDDDAFDHGQFIDRGDEIEAEVVAKADIGDHCDIAHVKAEAFAQHAATGGFENGGINVGVEQHIPGALRAGAVTAIGALAVDVDAIGAGHADAHAIALENTADQAAGRRLAIGAGDGDDRNAGVVTIREHHADDGFANGAAFAERGVEVHAQARCSIHFNNAAALIFQRFEHGVADDIDAANVEADGLCGCYRTGG